MSKKLLIKTWGCQMNEYDSSKMADLLNAANGYELTEIPEEADVLLLNTCSIREKAQEKVFHQLGRWKTLKDKKPGVVIGVGGCVATQEGDSIRDRAPYVDVIFGPQTLHRLPEMIKQSQTSDAPVMDISFPEIEKFDRLPEPRAEGPTAFVSIMEGCSKYCTYCVVPYTRGEEVSRPMDDVLFEIAQLAEQGCVKLTCWVKTSTLTVVPLTMAAFVLSLNYCVWSPPLTASIVSALPLATHSNLRMTLLQCTKTRLSS